jgi:molecular chaperone GrpE
MTRKKDKDEHPESGVMSEEPEPAPPADIAQLHEELARARAREDELLRAVAELTNVNRRRKQDADTIALYGQENLVRSILPVLDDIDRALAASKDREGDPIRSGVQLIRERLWKTLEREGLEAIEALGAPFDPELHDAVSQQPGGAKPPGTVLEVVVPGYRFKGRVLRHAQVVVAETGKGKGELDL